MVWASEMLGVTSSVLGWIGFCCWSVCSYPQLILNFNRKSVVGLDFNFVLLDCTKHTLYFVYNASLFFSPVVQFQYHLKYGFDQMIPVAANDVAFSTHYLLLRAVTLFQIAIYHRGTQKVSWISLTIISAVWAIVAVCVLVALPSHSWLWLISVFSIIQVIMSVLKFIPQAAMNCVRKSTDGFSIGYSLIDIVGCVAVYGQMALQSIDQGSWVVFYGNIGKTLLILVAIFFDIVFICQHYLLLPAKKVSFSPKTEGIKEPLTKKPAVHPESDDV